jgi:hypothetical protein
MRFSALIVLGLVVIPVFARSSAAQPGSTPPATGNAAVDQLIPWLLDEDQQLRGVPFSELIFDTTGQKVVPFDAHNAVDQRVAKAIGAACDEAMKRLNTPNSEIQSIDRINEVRSHFEETLRELLNVTAGLHCDFPLTAEGKVQRSGYPDLRITDLESKRVFYLDPKVYAAGTRASSFRSFYFEPKRTTNKVRDHAVHFVVGFEHLPGDVAASLSRGDSGSNQNTASERRGHNTTWKFTRWDLVDLSRFTVRVKAEFQGSNRDMYRPEAIVASSVR